MLFYTRKLPRNFICFPFGKGDVGQPIFKPEKKMETSPIEIPVHSGEVSGNSAAQASSLTTNPVKKAL